MMNDDKKYEVVGDIRIKQPKVKKNKKKKKDTASLGIKLIVWFMFILMFASFIVPMAYYFISVITGS